MKTSVLFCLTLVAAAAYGQPPIAEHDRLVQEFMAERAKLIAAREQLATKAKKAKAEKDPKALKTAQDDAKQLERDFLTRTTELSRQIKAKEDEKKPALPADAKKSG